MVALLVSEGVDSLQYQKLVRGFCLPRLVHSIFKREEDQAMLAAQPEVLFTYPTPTGDYDKIWRPSLQYGVSLVSPRGTTMPICHPARLWPSSTHDRTAEPLASPGWALTAASCILMLCCRAAVGFSELPSALRTQRWSTVVSRAGAWTSSLFSTPCRRTCLDTTDYAASPGGVI